MSEIVGVEFEAHVVVGVDHFVRERVFEMSSIPYLVCTYQYSIFGVEASSLLLLRFTSSAANVGG